MVKKKKIINQKKTALKSAPAAAPASGQLAADKFRKIGDDLVVALKEVRRRYQKLDQGTKKKIIAGVAGTLALCAGIRAVKKMAKRKRKK